MGRGNNKNLTAGESRGYLCGGSSGESVVF